MTSAARKLGVARDRRKYKKAQTLGENKTLKRGIIFRDMVIGAQSKELVYVMYARIWEAIFQAAVLKCMEKFAGQLYTEVEVATQCHPTPPPLNNVSESGIVLL